MATALDERSLTKLLDIFCDMRVNKRELVKQLSISTIIEQRAVYEFILEYIRYHAFMYDTGSFPNGNMEIAKTMSDIRYALDDTQFM